MKKTLSLIFLLFLSLAVFANPDDDLWTALMDLNVAGIKAALAAGADVMKSHPTLGTPLNYAAAFGNAEVVQAVLDGKPLVDVEYPANKFTPLASAVVWGNLDAVKLLLKAGADANKVFPTATILSLSFGSANAELIRALIASGTDVKKTITVGAVVSAPIAFFVTGYKTPSEVVEYLQRMKPIFEKMGVKKMPERLSDPREDLFSSSADALQVLVDAGADINGVQEVRGTKSKKCALAIALETEKDEIADALTEAGADKNGPGMKEVLAVIKANSKITPFNEATEKISKIKAAYDFPNEGRHANGAGYSANMDLLKEKPKRVALISYYVYDAGKGRAKLSTVIWRTPENKGQSQVNAFYEKSIGPLRDAFKQRGIDLLTPHDFLDTEEKADYYYGFVQETAKKEKTSITRSKSRTMKFEGPIFTTTTTTTTTATISTLKVCPKGMGYRAFFVANEAEDESDIKNFQGGIFTANRKLTSNLGYELCKGLGVDAVMVVYIATRKPKHAQDEYGVNAVVSIILGPNPGRGEDTDPDAKNLGQFYCGTRTYYSSPEIFQIEKAKPKVDGIENVLTVHANKLCDYMLGKEKD